MRQTHTDIAVSEHFP